MEIFSDNFFLFSAQGGLNGLWESLKTNWIAPLYIAVVAIFALTFLKDRSWTKILGFVGIAAIVGLIVFYGPSYFGEGGSLTEAADDAAKQINMIVFN